MGLNILVLGGTTLARVLSEELAREARHAVLLSFAGRTVNPELPALPSRVGGFGGVDGLVRFLEQHRFDAVIDGTHAFAAQMSRHATLAAARTDTPLLRLVEPAWQPTDGDHWISVSSMEQAAAALGKAPRRVFLTIGRLEAAAFRAAPQHDYLVRAVDAFDPGLIRARVFTARGPFTLASELALLRDERVEVLVSKNAGTRSTYAKLEAARMLGIDVVMVERPALPFARSVASVAEARAYLDELQRTKRGV